MATSVTVTRVPNGSHGLAAVRPDHGGSYHVACPAATCPPGSGHRQVGLAGAERRSWSTAGRDHALAGDARRLDPTVHDDHPFGDEREPRHAVRHELALTDRQLRRPERARRERDGATELGVRIWTRSTTTVEPT